MTTVKTRLDGDCLQRIYLSLEACGNVVENVIDFFACKNYPEGLPQNYDGQSADGRVRFEVRSIPSPNRPSKTPELFEISASDPSENGSATEARDWIKSFIQEYQRRYEKDFVTYSTFLKSKGSPWYELEYGRMNIPAFHNVRERLMEDWELVKVGDPKEGNQKIETMTNLQGEEVSLHSIARYYYRKFDEESNCDQRIILDINAYGTVQLAALHISSEQIEKLVKDFDDGIQKEFGSLSHAITPTGSPIKLDATVTWNDLFLDPEVKDLLTTEISGFFANQETFKKMGIPHRRGLLLHGPPGTGKTMFGKLLVSTIDDCLFIWITASEASDSSNISTLFRFARKASRAILFFEDLDLYASKRSSYGDSSTLGELLAQMDGMFSNDGMMVIATTNDLDAIEPALKDRPSRFDRLIEFPAPGLETRKKFLHSMLFEYGVTEEVIEKVAKRTDRYSGAQLKELAIVAKTCSANRGSMEISNEDIATAVTKAKTYKSRPIGFSGEYQNGVNEQEHLFEPFID